MDTILEIARRHGIAVVEDNAHGLFARYKGRHLGTFGALATQSFHETKNINLRRGGALLINDASYIARAEILRDKGTNRKQFLRGEVDKYTWVEVGSSYPPSTFWPHSSSRSSRSAMRSSNAAPRFGTSTTGILPDGRRRTVSSDRPFPIPASRPTTCTICSCRRSMRASV